jgi:hypothetical protein
LYHSGHFHRRHRIRVIPYTPSSRVQACATASARPWNLHRSAAIGPRPGLVQHVHAWEGEAGREGVGSPGGSGGSGVRESSRFSGWCVQHIVLARPSYAHPPPTPSSLSRRSTLWSTLFSYPPHRSR